MPTPPPAGSQPSDWTKLNRANWDEHAAPHAGSPDYAVQRFIDDASLLSDVVRFDGLTCTAMTEHDSVPWDAMPGQMERLPGGEFRLRDRPRRLPHTYTLLAMKPRLCPVNER